MVKITGTYVWYFYVCKREVWLVSRQLTPEQDNVFIEIGRILHNESYKNMKKEILIENMKIDLIKKENENLVVAEIKKSSKFEIPAKMQLAFYLYNLKNLGIETKGELLIPKERKRIAVELNEEIEKELLYAISKIQEIISSEKPPAPEKNKFCKNCAYREFCFV